MAQNTTTTTVGYTPGSGAFIATDQQTIGGQAADIQWITLAGNNVLRITDGNIHSVAAKYIVGIENNSSVVQTATLNGFDNASATSGTQVIQLGLMGPNQILTYPGSGKPLSNGLTVQASGVLAGISIDIYWR